MSHTTAVPQRAEGVEYCGNPAEGLQNVAAVRICNAKRWMLISDQLEQARQIGIQCYGYA
jgi:hypothetical protein